MIYALLPISFLAGAPGGFEILVVMLALLLLFGAKRLPEMARTLGRTLESFRRATREVTDEIMNATDVTKPSPPRHQLTPGEGPAPSEETGSPAGTTARGAHDAGTSPPPPEDEERA